METVNVGCLNDVDQQEMQITRTNKSPATWTSGDVTKAASLTYL